MVRLCLGYDPCDDRDVSVLTVFKPLQSSGGNVRLEMVNIFYGDEATEIYKKLTEVNNDSK